MKKNPKNSSVQPQLSQQQQEDEQLATPLSTLTMDELESVQGGWNYGAAWLWGPYVYKSVNKCNFCDYDNSDS